MCLSVIISTLIIYGLFSLPIPNDTMFISGRIDLVEYHPYFKEKYKERHESCTTDDDGDIHCKVWYTTEYVKHYPYYLVKDTIEQEWKIKQDYFLILSEAFGNHKITSHPDRCYYGGNPVEGDSNLYTWYNESNAYFPTNVIAHWYNPIKNKQTIFNKKKNILIKYPISIDQEHTNRLLTQTDFTQKDWDILNTKLFEAIRANIILLKANSSEEINEIKDSWLDGKKNDIIIAIVGDYKNPSIVKVFGWTETSRIKYELEQYIIDNGIKKNDLDNILSICIKYYIPYDFSKFKYLKTPPSIWCFIITFIVNIIIIYVCLNEFLNNWANKKNSG